jgi:putative acetyltransferase
MLRSGVRFVVDTLEGPEIAALLDEHVSAMYATSPAGSVHVLDLSGLRDPAVTVWTAWNGDALLGMGALKRLSPDHAEVKSMRTSSAHLRQGVAGAMLIHILGVARDVGYTRVSLETGSQDYFAPARALYERHGFVACDPFEGYVEDPHSAFYTLKLT